MSISKKRKDMGEEAWAEYQAERNRQKARDHYKRNEYHCTSYRIRTKIKLIEYKGGKCSRCGYDKPIPRVYAFHHVDPGEKDFTISKWTNCNFEKLKKEADKCILVCANCHAEIHDSEHEEKRKNSLEEYGRTRPKEKTVNVCANGECGESFTSKNGRTKFCSKKCASFSARKVVRPSREQLEKDIATMTMVAIGEKYSVSNITIKKWATSYGIECGRKRKKH